MKMLLLTCLISLMLVTTGCGQAPSNKTKNEKQVKVGGGCEGCEAVYESPIAFEKLGWIDTLPDFNEPGPKLEVTGTIYKRDGKTPAPGVILYVYHTDQKGLYSTKGGETGWGKRHGYIRGWLKTNEKGQYKFYTLRPASYPQGRNPQHIHPTIKEPGYSEYWIDAYEFADDPFLDRPAGHQPRCGSGVLTTVERDGMQRATRDIILGLEVPGYPKS
jgi:protocatechuate 3,4-dioxygenase, beta subunit